MQMTSRYIIAKSVICVHYSKPLLISYACSYRMHLKISPSVQKSSKYNFPTQTQDASISTVITTRTTFTNYIAQSPHRLLNEIDSVENNDVNSCIAKQTTNKDYYLLVF